MALAGFLNSQTWLKKISRSGPHGDTFKTSIQF
jgi:hypothetical protein